MCKLIKNYKKYLSILFIKSLLFYFLFIIYTLFIMIILLPIIFISYKLSWKLVILWAKYFNILLNIIIGVKIQIKGLNNIPKINLKYIVACKHQSIWETIALICYLPNPIFLMKKELNNIPIFAWYLKKFEQITIDRYQNNKNLNLNKIIYLIKNALSKNKQLVIFPEGTRRNIDDKPKYKKGIAYFYKHLNCNVLPIAHNAGLLWPKSSWIIYPGIITIEFLPIIKSGLSMNNFYNKLINNIEYTTNNLIKNNK